MRRGRKASESIEVTSDAESTTGATEPVRDETELAGIPVTDFASESPAELGTFESIPFDGPDLGTTSVGSRTTGKRRGRPPGSASKNKASSAKIPIALKIDKLSDMLQKVHVGLAMATGCPEMLLDPKEATETVVATTELLEHYDLNPDPKTVAWLNFLGTVGMVYGTRVMAIYNRPKKETKKSEQSTTEKVVSINA